MMSEDGNFVAVGALLNDNQGANAGMVKVYERVNDNWIQEGQTLYGESSGAFFGNSLAINSDGSIISVGTNQFGGDNGVVKTYQNINGFWEQLGSDIEGMSVGEQFGSSLSIDHSGSILAISAPFSNLNGNDSGYVKVFQFINSQWVQLGQTLVDDPNGSVFGASISLDENGDVLAVGVLSGNGVNLNGAVKVYSLSEGEWAQIGNSILGDPVFGNSTGASVSISGNGNLVAVGDVGNYQNGNDSGQTRLFQLLYDTWTQVEGDINGVEFSQSAASLDLNNTGELVAIGAPLSNENGEFAGKVSVYSFTVNSFPTAMCKNATLFLNEDGTAILEASEVDEGSFDEESSNLIVSVSKDLFNCVDIGDNEVIVFVDDGLGLISECTAIVSVLDEISPIIECPSVLIIDTEEESISFPDFSSLIADNCGVVNTTISQLPQPNTIINADSNVTVELLAMDASGNSNSCTFEVEINLVLNVEKNLAKELSLYPNPTNNFITLLLPKSQIRKVIIYDVEGRIVFEENYIHSIQELTLDLKTLGIGVYFIKVNENDRNSVIKKIIKK